MPLQVPIIAIKARRFIQSPASNSQRGFLSAFFQSSCIYRYHGLSNSARPASCMPQPPEHQFAPAIRIWRPFPRSGGWSRTARRGSALRFGRLFGLRSVPGSVRSPCTVSPPPTSPSSPKPACALSRSSGRPRCSGDDHACDDAAGSYITRGIRIRSLSRPGPSSKVPRCCCWRMERRT